MSTSVAMPNQLHISSDSITDRGEHTKKNPFIRASWWLSNDGDFFQYIWGCATEWVGAEGGKKSQLRNNSRRTTLLAREAAKQLLARRYMSASAVRFLFFLFASAAESTFAEIILTNAKRSGGKVWIFHLLISSSQSGALSNVIWNLFRSSLSSRLVLFLFSFACLHFNFIPHQRRAEE